MIEIGIDEVEQRLIRAVRLDIAMHDRERNALRVKIQWPSYSHDRADLNCQAENSAYLADLRRQALRLREWDNRPAQNDYLVAMGWLSRMLRDGLAPKRMRRSRTGRGLSVVQFSRLVAWGVSFRTIGEQDGTGEQQAARRWAGIVEACHAIANGAEHRLRRVA